jgi:hypothetical protein
LSANGTATKIKNKGNKKCNQKLKKLFHNILEDISVQMLFLSNKSAILIDYIIKEDEFRFECK